MLLLSENLIEWLRKAKLDDLDDILALNFKLFKKEYKEYDKRLDINWTYGIGKKFFRDRIIDSKISCFRFCSLVSV